MSFVVVAVAAEVEEIKLVDKAFFFEEVDGAVDGDEVDGGIHFLGALEDLVDVEVLLGGVHDFEDDAALAGQANSLFAEGFLEAAGGFGGVDAFAGGDAMCGRGGHEGIVYQDWGAGGIGGEKERFHTEVTELRARRAQRRGMAKACCYLVRDIKVTSLILTDYRLFSCIQVDVCVSRGGFRVD